LCGGCELEKVWICSLHFLFSSNSI
jgi:hypothetical protein